MSLLTRLLLLVLLAVLPAVGVGVYHEAQLRHIREDQVHEEALRLARLADSEMGRIAEGTRQLIAAFGENPGIGKGDWTSCDRAAARLLTRFDSYFNIGVATADGDIVCSGRPDAKGANVSASASFQKAMAAENFAIGTYDTTSLQGTRILPFTEPLLNADGHKRGLIFATLKLDWLRSHFSDRFIGSDVTLAVVDREGTILLRFPDPDRWVGTKLDPKYSAQLNAPADGTAEIVGLDGVRRVLGYSPLAVEPAGLYVGVGLTKAAVFAGIEDATFRGTVLVACCLCLALAAAWVGGAAFIRRPIGALLQASEAWRRGNYTARTGLTDQRSEIARLGRAFDEMAVELEVRESELRQANELLEQRVATRTADLVTANQRLAIETEERRRVEAVLHHAQKLEAIGQLTSGVAHDFNNLLTAVLGNIEIAQQRIKDEVVRNLLANASRAAERGAHLNEQLLAFARKQHLQPRPVDVNELVRGLSEMLHHSIGTVVRIEQRLAENLWPAMADPNQVELVVLNLAINARDAMPIGGRLLIETRNSDPRDPQLPTELDGGDFVCIAVSDTGTGMSDEVLSRAIEPFFTTKKVGEGSGLGLSMVYGVAKQSGGALTLSSRAGEGTTVCVYLPRAMAEPEIKGNGRLLTHSGFGAAASVLLIDDDADVRQVTATMLEGLGCRVVATNNGADGLAALDGERNFDLAMIDFAMSEMNGVEVAHKIFARRPKLPVVIVTGYADTTFNAADLPQLSLLKKPFHRADLAAVLTAALCSPQRPADNVVSLRAAVRT